MVSNVFCCLVCALYVILLPTAWAGECSGFWDTEGNYHETRQCGALYCCGSCDIKFCCDEAQSRLDQELCTQTPQRHYGYNGRSNSYIVLIAVIGSIIPVVIFGTLLICFLAPCCILYKHCRNRRHQPQFVTTTTTTVVPLSPQSGTTTNPGYQSVPVQPGYVPTVPPPYVESSQPMYPLHPTGPPPHEEFVQPPYNPSYAPNP